MIQKQLISPWAEGLIELARRANVCCKLSGMVTEARWKQWKPGDFEVYLDTVPEAFGIDRVMIGSDWPVCLLSGEYEPVMRIVFDYIERFSIDERAKVLGLNCARFYGIR